MTPCPSQVGLIGFLVVIGMSKMSAKKTTEEEKTVQFETVSTPKNAGSGTPIDKKSGSIMTPGGRRSARIAKNRRKED